MTLETKQNKICPSPPRKNQNPPHSGVNVPCVYSHAMSELLKVTQVFVVMLV